MSTYHMIYVIISDDKLIDYGFPEIRKGNSRKKCRPEKSVNEIGIPERKSVFAKPPSQCLGDLSFSKIHHPCFT